MNKIFELVGLGAIMMANGTFGASKPAEEFEKAWENADYTQITLQDVDINDIIQNYYDTSEPVHFTRAMLWDLECKKAWDPKTYIPHVVSDGQSWGKSSLEDGTKWFTRSSQQRQWISGEHAEVIEEAYLLDGEQRVVFLGVPSAENNQAVFHVEHGVSGTEDRPLNTWRIVHLTAGKDEALIDRFAHFRDATTLPKYVEVYIEKDLNIRISKRKS